MVGTSSASSPRPAPAGVDFGTNSRDDKDVQKGGYVGIIAAIVLTAGISVIAVAGARAAGVIDATTLNSYNMTTPWPLKLPPASLPSS